MKNFILVLVGLALSSGAFAYPKAGDKVVFSTLTLGGILDLEYLNQGLDSSKNLWKIYYKTAVNGVVKNQGVQEYLPEDMITSSMMQQVLENCESQGGTLTSLILKPGTFDTCYQKTQDGEVWFGDVPFGIVAFTTSSKGQKYYFQLTALALGTK